LVKVWFGEKIKYGLSGVTAPNGSVRVMGLTGNGGPEHAGPDQTASVLIQHALKPSRTAKGGKEKNLWNIELVEKSLGLRRSLQLQKKREPSIQDLLWSGGVNSTKKEMREPVATAAPRYLKKGLRIKVHPSCCLGGHPELDLTCDKGPKDGGETNTCSKKYEAMSFNREGRIDGPKLVEGGRPDGSFSGGKRKKKNIDGGSRRTRFWRGISKSRRGKGSLAS